MGRLNEWLTLLTNLGVVAGLLILVFEVNQNTKALQNETDVAVYGLSTEAQIVLIEDDGLQALFVKALENRWEDFSDAERIKLGAFFSLRVDNVALQFRLFRRTGAEPDNIVFPEELFEYGVFRSWWADNNWVYEDDFVAFFERMIDSRSPS